MPERRVSGSCQAEVTQRVLAVFNAGRPPTFMHAKVRSALAALATMASFSLQRAPRSNVSHSEGEG
jgi:hypothetical protein